MNDDIDVKIKPKSVEDFNGRSLWVKYLLALGLIAICVSTFFAMSEISQNKGLDNGTAINVSGRQRMLSQRIALFANRYVQNYVIPGYERENRKYLTDARNLFEKSHIALVEGSEEMGLTDKASRIAGHIYFKEPYFLDQEVKDYIGFVDVVLDPETSDAEKQDAVREINNFGRFRILGHLNEVVQVLEDNNAKEIDELKLIERIAFITALLLLLGEGVFIFWPTHRYIVRTIDHLAHMEDVKFQKQAADDANKAKSEFLANMSHELRTPLNAVIGMVQLIDERKLDDETQEAFQMISMSSKNLLDIVNDILDLSKIEAGEVELDHAPFNVSQRLRHATQSLKALASKKGLVLRYTSNNDLCFVLGDGLRYSRVITNLVSNAIRYTDNGSIDVDVQIEEAADNLVTVTCRVSDTGVGIAPDKIPVIFDKFTQVGDGKTRKEGGTGLGLAITKELVELMAGDLEVHSVLGKGTSFTFTVQFESTEASDSYIERLDGPVNAGKGIIPLEDVRILAAEDHMMNQTFLKKLFLNCGIEHYKIVEDGRSALRVLEREDFDVILMDCHMPELDGYEATKAIRGLENALKAKTPIVAMTANAMEEDEQKCLDVGMNSYISKPIDVAYFKSVLSQWVRFPPAS